ncbi:predicted subunit of the Multisubunit Na+/H+ antiporter [Longilinea arvoryzae]|uniref:Predicted subunit of the Multisubunit Na+/H+ antiporter n=1 Tax=Longilinea arvoryzae TaxID=360412 RepID=A0A0S7BNK3_9CHLR|nr:NADH-quinone oxidoreductase subunit J [Longilinea arvoryzae]GAP15445.1 predicted subunit of the Multisubunit Na+/H+ antiporter [Longilinea arvoryzae]
MWQILIMVGILLCAIMAIRTHRLLVSAIWLAGTSALVALFLYLLGAPEIAVIELSVGAGLVTVLFVFAINISGEEAMAAHPLIPRPLAWAIITVSILLVGWLMLPGVNVAMPALPTGDLGTTLWQSRSLDVFLMAVLILAGALAMLGLLAEDKKKEVHE